MTNISEYIHEIIAVFIFAAAVTILVSLTSNAAKADYNIDQDMRERTNVMEGMQMSTNSKAVTGAQVYTDCKEYAESNPDLEINIATSESENFNITSAMKNDFSVNHASEDLLTKLTSIGLSFDTKYNKNIITDSQGKVTSIRYIKV